MAEHCDFDELAALLEEDSCDEEEFQPAENAPVKSVKSEYDVPEQSEIKEQDDSSDDDIDEDELDRLAGLAEADHQEQEVAENVKVKKEPKEDETNDKEDNSEVQTETRKEEEDGGDEGSDEEQEDVQDKIQQMYAMIQQLQSQVDKKSKKKGVKGEKSPETPGKTKTSPGLFQSNEAVKGSSDKPTPKSERKKPPSSVKSAKSENGVNPTQSKPKLIEGDIFSQATQDPVPSSSNVGKIEKKASDVGKTEKKAEKPVKKENTNTEKKFTVKEAQEQLFGSDSDSDWEGLDGERPSQFNTSGKEIKQIIKKEEKQRVAHSAAYDLKAIANRKPSWGKKDVYKQRTTEGSSSTYTRSVSPPRSAPLPRRVEEEDKNVLCDPFSELRIVNPRVSSTQLKMRMQDRHMFQMSTLHRRVNTSDMEKDWVTIGVLVQKSEPKMSSKGKQYSIWSLSDLKDCQSIIKMFLFGEVHNQHWKTSVGSVMGFLNPSPMSNNEKYQNKSEEVTLCVDNGNKVMHMGQSKDFGICKSFTKAGRKCSNFINKAKAEFCEYHISQAYKHASAKRGDLQGSMSGPIPKKHVPSLKQKVLGNTNETVFYQGNSFSSSNTQQKKKGVSMNSLQSHEKTKGPLKRGHVTTLSLYEMRPEDAEKLEKYEEKKKVQDQKAFHEMLATPTVGSMNLVKHLIGSGKKEEKQQIAFQSVTAQDMFKTRSKLSAKPGYAAVGSQSSTVKFGVGSPKTVSATPSPLPRLNVPQLGRGFGSGSSIFLESPTKKAPARNSAELFKQKAINKIKKKGGVKAENPNAVKKKINEDKQEKIKKRLHDDSDCENDKGAENTQVKKKPRLTGGVDLDDPEIQKLINKKSKHDNLLLEVEQEKQDEYFDVLEKKEKMENKMSEITKVKVKAVSCKKCGYTSFKATDRCREEKHPLHYHEATKRFFMCQHCKMRAISLDRLPTQSCNCGKNMWQRTSMMREKKGPKLESEQLLLRGEENKFLNSLE